MQRYNCAGNLVHSVDDNWYFPVLHKLKVKISSFSGYMAPILWEDKNMYKYLTNSVTRTKQKYFIGLHTMERQKQVALIYEKNTGKKSPATLPFGYFLYFNPHKSMS